MALYQSSMKNKSTEICQILRTEQGEGFTLYVIEVTVRPFHWSVSHRYSEFRDLHEKLVAQFNVDKNLLPPKKIFGNQSETFIHRRLIDLQTYLQTLLQQFETVPFHLAEFLDFGKYEVHGITEGLAEKLFYQEKWKLPKGNFWTKIYTGDQILTSKEEFTMTPLQLHALSERLKLPEPTCWSGSKIRDLGHLLDFVFQLQNLRIVGSDERTAKSDIVPNKLTFDLSPFRSLLTLKVECCNLEVCLTGVEGLRQSVTNLSIHNSVQDLKALLLAAYMHWSPSSNPTTWPCWQMVTFADFSHNKIRKISPAVRLLIVVEHLNLSYNKIEDIENLESLPRLSTLNLSHNRISQVEMLHTRLGNVRHLNLSKNSIVSLQGMSRFYSLIDLDLSHNQISSLDEVGHIGQLPCLEKLSLEHNTVTTTVDYRPHVLLAFGPHASEISIDGTRASQKELDTMAVLQALKAAREGRILRHCERTPHGEKATGVLTTASDRSSTKKAWNQTTSAAQFRQQVTALRRLGGSDWLGLLNQLQKKSQANALDSSCGAIDHLEKSKCKCMSLTSALDNGLTEALVKQNCDMLLDSSSNSYLIPRWLSKMDTKNSDFLSYIESIPLMESSKSLLNEGVPVFSCWIILMSGSTNIPACLVLTSQGILIFKLKSLYRSLQNDQAGEKWPLLSHLITVVPSEVLSVVTGPCNSYVEIQIGSPSGIQTYVLLTMNQETTILLSEKLTTHYDMKVSKKHTLLELEAAVSRGLQSLVGDVNSTTNDMLYCRRVLRLHCSEHMGSIHYIALTPSHLLTIEEIPDLHPLCDFHAAFHVCTNVSVRTNIVSVIMKDDNFISQIFPSQSCLDMSDHLWELYVCGYWLLVDFETEDLFHIRFLNQEDRSKFLETFLNVRGT